MTPPNREARGMAIVLVLVFLVLISTLVLAFFSSVTTELSGAKSYADGASAKHLADSAVHMAMGQIKLATSGDSTTAWASQPGMIRTYDDAGQPVAYYKLYSSDNMIVPGSQAAAFSFANDLKAKPADQPADWSGKPAIFTDLNSPVVSGAERIHPILDPAALTLVPGFRVETGANSPVATGSNANPVPMPVKWIYVLRDGTLTAPDDIDATGKIARWTDGKPAPGEANPIVGRIAFWTDDESCKVNINTASEGTYSDMPRTGRSDDDGLVKYNQPVRGEYQRYPGHPATTSLSAVFAGLTDKEDLYRIIPRVANGGSKGGTVKTTQGAKINLTKDTDRLYASIDELIFDPERAANDPILNKGNLGRAHFFLTASSRAPDLNLFGKPRVNIWPIHEKDSPSFRTAYDSTIAFCSTLGNDLPDGPYRYYFQRSNPTDPHVDLPAAPSVSGLGRNRMLINYLQYLTSKNIPGFGGNFRDKYNATDAAGLLPDATCERDQILTQIFDYIRTTNLGDSALTPQNRFAPGVGEWSNGAGQVVPIEDTATRTRGFGRYRTLQGGNFLFLTQVDGDVPESQVNSAGTALPAENRVPPGYIRVQAVFIPQLYDVAVGSIFNVPRMKLTITGLETFTVNGTNMGLPASITPKSIQKDWLRDGAAFGEQFGPRQFLDTGDSSQFISNTIDLPKAPGSFNFAGGKVTFTFESMDNKELQTVVLEFPAEKFPLPKLARKVDKQNADDGKIGYNLRFFNYSGPNSLGGRLQSPRSLNDLYMTGDDVVRSVSSNSGDIRLIAARKTAPPPGNPAYPFAKNPKYSPTYSSKGVPSYTLSSQTHNIWFGDGYSLGTPYIGRLVKDAAYATKQGAGFENYPDVPVNGTAVGKIGSFAAGDIPGDWDNGVAEIRDGPYINKPDEGDMGTGPSEGNFEPYKWKYHVGVGHLSDTLFTPNRQIPSAVMFGSLPTGVLANKPWQTLLFRPGPANHPGLGKPQPGRPPYQSPPDHLLLDLFHMPVVEPYAISEPLSTAGRINMNYQIAPFTYINRDTGIRAVLKSEKLVAIANTKAPSYKSKWSTKPLESVLTGVNVDATLQGFEARFARNDLFRSATEICDLDIVPENYTGTLPVTRASMDEYWNNHAITGDNSRERIYATVYPRLTSKSNTFTIHFRVQTLRKVSGSTQEWQEGKDQVTGEYRGSQLVERYIDPSDAGLPDFAAGLGSTPPIDRHYRFRVLCTKRFAP